jgi:ubiquinone/menaquinone biosynthesis C-methylase UbiE
MADTDVLERVMANDRTHWEQVYRTRRPEEVSWFQPEARLSLDLIRSAAPGPGTRIIDVGGGSSTLVDGLVAASYLDVTVLDISGTSLALARQRLRRAANRVCWLEADVLSDKLPEASFDLWHDRAVFHFLTSPFDRARYIAQVRRTVRPGGHVLVATFADDGPTKCSGLPVTRYGPSALHQTFGTGFRLLASRREEHITPAGVRQPFTYCLCVFEPDVRGHRAA